METTIEQISHSIDGKKIGFLRKVLADYMVVKKGFIILTKYFIPTSLADTVSKKGIRIRVTAVEAKTKYSSINMKNLVNNFESLAQLMKGDGQNYNAF